VFDGDDRRALRITGEETAKNRPRDAWSVADDAMLQRIAHSSMDQLSAFLTSSDVAPGTPDSGPRLALAGAPDSSPEAAGIFRIFQAKADPAASAEVPVAAGQTGWRWRRRTAESVHFIHPVQKLRDNGLDSYCEPLPALL
jgi:hypothetical protein